ncbi:AbrB/MazE/SpoVT family DNA-binding domain-containing protein [Lactobacillus hominis]|uniref:AbrB/MazE/SpoVT family DNA-binding domain-containing protein n=1 Tax=Lactobacillus hominis TaxID=1203033 RepID=UPI00260AA9A8|nr:AbrB/MazE/SpoVT family DNA-binding domain-containing protein [Lactobacillus hominis]
MNKIKLQKWGNSQGIRLSKSLLKELGITSEKATFEVKVKNKELILKKKKESKLAQRFEGFDYETYWKNWEKEHPGQSKEPDWGEPVGNEIKW